MTKQRLVATIAAAVAGLAAWAAPRGAQAQPPVAPQYQTPPPPPGYAPAPGAAGVTAPAGYHTHDGVYVRLQLGGGYGKFSSKNDGLNLAIKGGGASVGVAVGGALAPNFILYGTVTGISLSEPDVEFNGATGTGNGAATYSGIGAGVAYYLQPSNVFFAGSLLLGRMSLSDDDGDRIAETKSGLGVEALVGKEWWVSDNWGLGVSGQLLFGTMKDKEAITLSGPTPRWRALSFAILFSATFN